jgi:hypothetical protein
MSSLDFRVYVYRVIGRLVFQLKFVQHILLWSFYILANKHHKLVLRWYTYTIDHIPLRVLILAPLLTNLPCKKEALWKFKVFLASGKSPLMHYHEIKAKRIQLNSDSVDLHWRNLASLMGATSPSIAMYMSNQPSCRNFPFLHPPHVANFVNYILHCYVCTVFYIIMFLQWTSS